MDETPDRKERAVVLHRSRAWTDAASRGYELLIVDGKLQWSLIHFWPGNAVSIRTQQEITPQRWTHVAVSYDGSSRASGLRIYVDGQVAETEVVRDGLTRTIAGGGYDHIDLGERFRDRGFKDGKMDDFRVFPIELTEWEVTLMAKSTGEDFPPDGSDVLSDALRDLQDEHEIELHPETVNVRHQLLAAREKLFAFQDTLFNIMVMQELEHPKPAYLLIRGEYHLRDIEVPAATPLLLNPFPEDQPVNRLGFARWTVAGNIHAP